jgi:hypothetical protein
MDKNIIDFKFKSNYYINIVMGILFIILLIIIFLIIKNISLNTLRVIYILLAFLILWLIILFLHHKLTIINGEFEFNEDSINYTCLKKTYIINYDEIAYINKNTYIDKSNLINQENYQFVIKIKNSGQFNFLYYDDSLDEAINYLAKKAKIKISEK